MCYEFSEMFERARARQLRKELQREQSEKRQQAPAGATPATKSAEPEPAKVRETIPV